MSALTRVLLTGGLTKEEFESIREDIVDANLRGLLLYSPIGCVVFCLLSLLSQLTQGAAADNLLVYVLSCVAMGAIMAGSIVISRKQITNHYVLTFMVYAFMLVLYIFAISVSLMHAGYPAVSSIAFLLVTPLLFTDRPLRVMASTVIAVVAICIASFITKVGIVAIDDIWNAVTFGAVALLSDVFIQRIRLLELHQARMIAYLSETDTLTGLGNRNSYETRLDDYPQSGAETLVCAYADANGLRELNNTKGHEAGDALLRAIAHQMRKAFGAKNSYRIGGDEFVSIIPDGSVDKVRARLQRMQTSLEGKGYSVSCGASSASASDANMRALVREAEKEMYAQKRAYHAGDNVQ